MSTTTDNGGLTPLDPATAARLTRTMAPLPKRPTKNVPRTK